jgi:hypothetical protein
MSGSVFAICGGLVCALAMAFAAAPALAAEEAAPLSFGGVADEPVPVVFDAHRQGDAVASLSFVLETGAIEKAGQLSLRFLPQQADLEPEVVVAEGSGEAAKASVVLRREKLPRIGAEAAVPLVLEFRQPFGVSPTAVDGLLVARLRPKAGKPSTADLRVEGELGQLSISPSKVTLQRSEACPIDCGHGSAEVQVTGPGAAALPQDGVIATSALGGGRSGTSTVELSRADNVWTLTTTASSLGEMSGKVPLIEGVATPPTVEVTVEDGIWFGIVAGLVLVGSFFGGFVLPQLGIGRRRKILSGALMAALKRYEEAEEAAKEKEKTENPTVERPAGYSMEGDLGPPATWNSEKCEPYQGPRGVRALLCRIATSRSEADFTECEKQATELIATIDGWIALEPIVAQAERRLEIAKALPPNDGKKFEDSKIWLDLSTLVDEVVQFRPTDLLKVEEKASHLQAMTSAVIKAEGVWKANTAVLARPGALANVLKNGVLDLPGQEQLAPPGSEPLSPPDLAETTAIRGRLNSSLSQLQAIGSQLGTRPEAESDLSHTVTAIEGAAEQASEASGEVDEETEESVVVPHPESDRHLSFQAPTRTDFVLSFVSGTAAAIAYTATIYTDTWGSVAQIATAVTAGFLAPSVAQWAALPIFRSVRWQSAAPAAGDEAK